jgi:hypothetical protein
LHQCGPPGRPTSPPTQSSATTRRPNLQPANPVRHRLNFKLGESKNVSMGPDSSDAASELNHLLTAQTAHILSGQPRTPSTSGRSHTPTLIYVTPTKHSKSMAGLAQCSSTLAQCSRAHIVPHYHTTALLPLAYDCVSKEHKPGRSPHEPSNPAHIALSCVMLPCVMLPCVMLPHPPSPSTPPPPSTPPHLSPPPHPGLLPQPGRSGGGRGPLRPTFHQSLQRHRLAKHAHPTVHQGRHRPSGPSVNLPWRIGPAVPRPARTGEARAGR